MTTLQQSFYRHDKSLRASLSRGIILEINHTWLTSTKALCREQTSARAIANVLPKALSRWRLVSSREWNLYGDALSSTQRAIRLTKFQQAHCELTSWECTWGTGSFGRLSIGFTPSMLAKAREQPHRIPLLIHHNTKLTACYPRLRRNIGSLSCARTYCCWIATLEYVPRNARMYLRLTIRDVELIGGS